MVYNSISIISIFSWLSLVSGSKWPFCTVEAPCMQRNAAQSWTASDSCKSLTTIVRNCFAAVIDEGCVRKRSHLRLRFRRRVQCIQMSRRHSRFAISTSFHAGISYGIPGRTLVASYCSPVTVGNVLGKNFLCGRLSFSL